MSFVVDASVAVTWFVEEPRSEAALTLLDAGVDLLAPDLLLVEVANALWKKLRRGAIAPHHLETPVRWIRTGVPQLVPIRAVIDDALPLTTELDHPIYDCLYLALAEIAGARVVTDDERLQRRVHGTRFAQRVLPLVELVVR